MAKKMKKIFKYLLFTLLIYLGYVFFMFVNLFKILGITETTISYHKEDILKVSEDALYANLIETHKDALDVRLNLILEATTSVNLTSYYFHDGVSADLITAALLKKADEDIKITILVDGKNPVKGRNYELLSSHNNIAYYFFEPFSLFSIHANNNVYHSKIMTIDERFGLIGGRNISDRFLLASNDFLTYDYDVLVSGKAQRVSPVVDMNTFIDESINDKHTKKMVAKPQASDEKIKLDLFTKLEDYYLELFSFDRYIDSQVLVDNITFVHSPLNRMNKTPVILETIKDLTEAEDEIIVQSPYITSSKLMRKSFLEQADVNVSFVTNNINSNPNFMALTGYFKIRNNLAKNHQVYEYQGSGSLHGKAILINQNISVVGSVNLDPRSTFLSVESAVIISGHEFNDLLNDNIKAIINQSLVVNSSGDYEENAFVTSATKRKTRTFFAKAISIISGLFDHLL